MTSLWKKLGAWTGSFALLGVGMVALTPDASAATLPLTVYNDNGTPTDFTAEIGLNCDGGGCDLTFTNTSDPAGDAAESAIHQLYFEEGFADYFSTAAVTGSTGTVSFVQGDVTPGTKPQAADLLGWTGTWSEGYFVRDGTKDDGINTWLSSGDSLTISLAFLGDAVVLTEELMGMLLDRIESMLLAVHVNECSTDVSCNAYATPIPGAIWLLGSALLGLFGFSARRRITG